MQSCTLCFAVLISVCEIIINLYGIPGCLCTSLLGCSHSTRHLSWPFRFPCMGAVILQWKHQKSENLPISSASPFLSHWLNSHGFLHAQIWKEGVKFCLNWNFCFYEDMVSQCVQGGLLLKFMGSERVVIRHAPQSHAASLGEITKSLLFTKFEREIWSSSSKWLQQIYSSVALGSLLNISNLLEKSIHSLQALHKIIPNKNMWEREGKSQFCSHLIELSLHMVNTRLLWAIYNSQAGTRLKTAFFWEPWA